MDLDQAPGQRAVPRGLDADPRGLDPDPDGLDPNPDGGPDSPPPLAGLTDDERRRALVAETARFAAAFQRWTEGRAGGGLPYTRLRLLQALHCGGPAIMRDLGARLGVSPRNMTAMVDALQEAHLVERRPHPADRRATLVDLTDDGRHEAEHLLGPRLDALAGLFEGFTLDEQQQFATTLHRLGQAMRDRQF